MLIAISFDFRTPVRSSLATWLPTSALKNSGALSGYR
jgi:hypothetical protein